MKRALVLVTILVLLAQLALADLSFTGVTPASGSTIPGSATTAFSVTVNQTCINGNLFFVSPPATYSLTCAGMNASRNIDLSLIADNTWYSWYPVVNSFVGPTYTFFVNKVPSVPTGLTGTATESSAILNWNDNPETDLSLTGPYKVYKNSVFLTTTTASAYTDTAVILGNTYSYNVSAVDNISQESAQCAPISVLIRDLTPPADPLVTSSSGVCNGTTKVCNVPILNPTFTINYTGTETANVNLTVQTGMNILARMYNNRVFSWPYTFPAAGTYFITFNATDAYGNYRESTYTMNMALGSTSIPITLLDMNHIGVVPYGVKTTANINGADCVVIGYNISMYYNAISPLYLKAAMSDITGTGGMIRVNEETSPTMYCGRNFNPADPCAVSGPTYGVDNAYTASPAITCVDETVGGSEDYMVYVRVPIPAGEVSGPYSVATTFGMFTTP